MSQSYFGNSYHTFRTAIFLNSISTSLSLPSRIRSIALEILHNLAVSLIQQHSQQPHTTGITPTTPTTTRRNQSCPLWSYDETSVVCVSSICMACKVIIVMFVVKLFSLLFLLMLMLMMCRLQVMKWKFLERIESLKPLIGLLIVLFIISIDCSSFRSVSAKCAIFRSPVGEFASFSHPSHLTPHLTSHLSDIVSLLKKYETKIVKTLSYDFLFTSLQSQVCLFICFSSHQRLMTDCDRLNGVVQF